MVGRSWRTAPKGYQVVWKEEPAGAPASDTTSEPEEKPRKSTTARRRSERRSTKGKDLPKKLGGKDRRRSGDRRKGFGKKPDAES